MDYLVQGTIYPDVIESGAGDAAVIKSHHNVGGLPDYVDFKEIIEPLRLLFKDEVRQLGRELGLPEYLVMPPALPRARPCHPDHRRHDQGEADTLREADFIFRDEIAPPAWKEHQPVFRRPHQYPLRGRHGRRPDLRLHPGPPGRDHSDFMTADWARIPYDVLDRISTRIVNEVKGINRIVLRHHQSKPPATVEWE